MERRGDINSDRSRKWINSLAQQFKEFYTCRSHRVFWSGNYENQAEFGRNEFLFDLVVCSVSTTKSLERKPRGLEFVAQCHWQVESEFNLGNTRALTVDMSKLVMGSAEYKLFIAAHRGDRNKNVLNLCAPIAHFCSGRLYFCFVSHPDSWNDGPRVPPELYEWTMDHWQDIPLPSTT